MAASPFVDHVRIFFTSGKGGPGVVAWRREKYVPKGGPNGGDGGRGGHIILEGDVQLWTLLDLKYRKYIKAEPGQRGSDNNKKGKNGKDQVLKVPLGTVIYNSETEEMIGEVTSHGERFILLKGGDGGFGNTHYKSSTNRAPTKATEGFPAQELGATLELKVLADVGLVGFPNAGKSTLLSVLSAAKPKIGAYPFTTLVPNLGIVKYHDFKSFVMADIPGIIEGAHLGKGLGHQFLRHIERNATLLIMISVESDDLAQEYHTLLNELTEFNSELLHKQRILAITKTDLLGPEELAELEQEIPEGVNYVFISAAAQQGLQVLKDKIWKTLDR
ncbi:MAG TPA: GTPase ObgE [Bacteroidetes bacterium]|nr:GTPase ObgE [Bacteroidota bacterium]